MGGARRLASSRRVRRGSLALLTALLAAWALAAPAAAAARCERLWAYPTAGSLAPAAPGEIVVPVVVRMMKHADCPDDAMCKPACGSDSPTCRWTPAQVDAFLGLDGLVNQIWAAARIRLAVVRVEQCDMAVLAGLGVGVVPGQTFLPTPDPGNAQWEASYHAVNRAFARLRVLNLFVWLRIGDPTTAAITYYGSSPLRGPAPSGRNPAAVWADLYCIGDFRPAECGRKIAHEVGHALSLPHADPGPNEADLGADAFPDCGATEADPLNLMRQDLAAMGAGTADAARFTSITESQACRARAAAQRFFKRRM